MMGRERIGMGARVAGALLLLAGCNETPDAPATGSPASPTAAPSAATPSPTAGAVTPGPLGAKPTPDPQAAKGVYVPKDLEDAFVELKKMLPPAELQKMKAGTEKEMINYHFSLGAWMRNNWGLWGGGSRLGTHFRGLGLRHPDDMSGLILDTFWCHLNGRPLRVRERVAEYQAYWAEMEAKQKGK